MDDALEQPTAVAIPPAEDNGENAEHLSDDEDEGGPDWTRMPIGSSARPIIPKRGDKEFEPRAGGPSGLQQHVLERVRSAMFAALDVQRTVSSKTVSYAVWYPALARAHVTAPRGIHFSSMGYSVPRPIPGTTSAPVPALDTVAKSRVKEEIAIAEKIRTHKRLELLPEETLYLVERGSMFCYKDLGLAVSDEAADANKGRGAPISVQQAYAEMIGREDLTLERYQVYAYLRRLGYVVTRARAPDAFYPIPATLVKHGAPTTSQQNGVRRHWLARWFARVCTSVRSVLGARRDWWSPLGLGGSWSSKRYSSYSSVFSALRFIPTGHALPLHHVPRPARPPTATAVPPPVGASASPYKVFYNLYKPVTSFRKTAPPPPDYRVVVVNARTTPMPTLAELTALFDELPELPPPEPRKRYRPPAPNALAPTADADRVGPAKGPASASASTPATPQEPSGPLRRSLVTTILQWFRRWFCRVAVPQASASKPAGRSEDKCTERRPNPFMALKEGKKLVVIAAVDAGTISFFRFSQGAFAEWPMAVS